jgi:hypothetical protein
MGDDLPRNYSSKAAEKFCAISGAVALYGFTVSNANAAARFILLFDLEALPADGAVPNAPFQVGTVATVGAAWIPPRRMERGIILAASTTQNTLTLATADHIFDVQYV